MFDFIGVPLEGQPTAGRRKVVMVLLAVVVVPRKVKAYLRKALRMSLKEQFLGNLRTCAKGGKMGESVCARIRF